MKKNFFSNLFGSNKEALHPGVTVPGGMQAVRDANVAKQEMKNNYSEPSNTSYGDNLVDAMVNEGGTLPPNTQYKL